MGSNQSAKHFTLLENFPLPCLRGTMKFFWFGLFLVSFAGEQPCLTGGSPLIQTFKQSKKSKRKRKNIKGRPMERPGRAGRTNRISHCRVASSASNLMAARGKAWFAIRPSGIAISQVVIWWFGYLGTLGYLHSTPHIVTLRGCLHTLPSFLSFPTWGWLV